MFIDIPVDKIRPGLTTLTKFLKEDSALYSDPIKVVGLVIDDEMVGVIIYNSLRIFSLAVAEDHRGCGYGKRLFTYVLNTEQPTQIVAYIPPANNKAVAAFINWGFIFEGFLKSLDHDKVCYRLTHRSLKNTEYADIHQAWLYEECCKLAEETIVAFSGGMIL